MLKLFAGLALACLATPAFAQAGCQMTVAGLIDHAGPDTYQIVDSVTVKAALFDQIVVVHYTTKEFLWFAKGGCIIAEPLLFGDTSAAAAPSPSVDPKPMRLRGGGVEIGV